MSVWKVAVAQSMECLYCRRLTVCDSILPKQLAVLDLAGLFDCKLSTCMRGALCPAHPGPLQRGHAQSHCGERGAPGSAHKDGFVDFINGEPAISAHLAFCPSKQLIWFLWLFGLDGVMQAPGGIPKLNTT